MKLSYAESSVLGFLDDLTYLAPLCFFLLFIFPFPCAYIFFMSPQGTVLSHKRKV
jgi:hypothetical protein